MLAAAVAPRPPGTASQRGLPPATTEMSLAWVARGLSFAATLPEEGFPFLRRKKKWQKPAAVWLPIPSPRNGAGGGVWGRHGWQGACPWPPGTPPGTQRFSPKAQLPAAARAWGEKGSPGVSDPGRCQPPSRTAEGSNEAVTPKGTRWPRMGAGMPGD